MKTKTLLASLALAGLAVAQPVSAATRSVDSLPQSGVRSTAAADRIDSLTGESEELKGQPLPLIILVFGSLAALLLALSGGKSNG